jgi:hypothetical protein
MILLHDVLCELFYKNLVGVVLHAIYKTKYHKTKYIELAFNLYLNKRLNFIQITKKSLGLKLPTDIVDFVVLYFIQQSIERNKQKFIQRYSTN